MGSELLPSIKEFAGSVEGSDTMREAAWEIVSLASEKVCTSDYDTSDLHSFDLFVDECRRRASHLASTTAV